MTKAQILASLQRAIAADPRSVYRISRDHAIGYSILQRLMAGEEHDREMSVSTAVRIAAAVNHEIVIRPTGRRT